MSRLRVYLVDDEGLALKRLERMLRATDRVDVSGSTTDPAVAVKFLSEHSVDVVFLDIQMPVFNGFEVLARLPHEPMVVFTTAFDHYALQAFDVNAVDYLLKPIEAVHLNRALAKLERMRGNPEQRLAGDELRAVARQLAEELREPDRRLPRRIASRIGERVVFVDVGSITHFYAKDKLTYAATASKDYVVDGTITEFESRLDPAQFVRIHRSTLLNLAHVDEAASWFGGGLIVRLKDGKRTELPVARDRVRELKSRLNF